MALVLGETQSESFPIASLATGQTFTRTASYINNASSVWNPTFSEIGGGVYRYSYVPSVAGLYEWYGVAGNGDPVVINFDVEATGVTVVVSAAVSGGLTVTLQELRRRVARRLGDYDQLTSTGNGTTSTIVDTLNVNTATEDMRGRIVVPTNGTNNGLTRRVSNMVDSTGTLTVTPAMTASTATNDTFDVFNKRGKGFTPAMYTAAINDAINDAFPLGLIELRADITPAYDYADPVITVPASFIYVHAVEWEDEGGYWNAVLPSNRTGQYGWVADSAAGEIRILGGIGYGIDGLTVRLTGYGRQPTLSAETDTCALNAEYIVARACYHLCAGHIDRNPDKYGPLVTLFLDESRRLRTRVRTLSPSGSRGELVRAA